MPTNADDVDDDDSPEAVILNPEKPLEMLRAIQSLFKRSSSNDDGDESISDQVRAEMANQNVTLNDLAMFGLADLESITASDILDSPFFVLKGLSAVPHVEQDAASRMSGDVSKTAREVLANYFGFNVHFVEWSSLATNKADENGADPPSNLRVDKYKTWGVLLYVFLNYTYNSEILQVGETKELAFLEGALNIPLESFGFTFVEIPGSAHDFEIREFRENGKPFIFGEGKESGMLPRKCIKSCSELCLFGFATRVVKACSRQTQRWKAQYRNLGKLLGLPNVVAVKDVDQQASTLTEELLKQEGSIQQVAASILEKRRRGLLEEHDAVNLWAAVMQACHYTVRNRLSMTMVLSARVFWFIRLRINENRCTVEISEGHRFGEPCFLRTLILFLIRARDADEMNNMELRKWEEALAKEETEKQKTEEQEGDTEDKDEYDGNAEEEEDRDEESGTPSAKRFKRSTSMSMDAAVVKTYQVLFPVGHHNSTRTQADPPRAESPDAKVESSTPRHVDKYGVAVPWLYQIGKELDLLATGRSGSVTKNMWDGKPVAVKTFILQKDDDRSIYDVYRHECNVLVALESLWGTHVPRFLFRHPWKTSPMIGLQLGEPLCDDMSIWDAQDRKKAEETIEQVAALGWKQHDMRGSNFVRLRKGNRDYIAMVDFESVKEIASAYCTNSFGLEH